MKYVLKTMIVSIIVNAILVCIKFIIGLLSNYKSLVADAIHSFSDLSTDFVAILGQSMASKKEDKNHPFGHGKIEYITSIIIGVCIMGLGISMLYSSLYSETVEPQHRLVALIAVLITIVLKYSLSKYVYYRGKKINSNILLASSKESMSDVLSAISVFIAIILSFYKDVFPIFKYADKAGGIIISFLIIKTSYGILRDNINAIIGESEQDEEVIYNIKGIIMAVEEVLSIDNLVVMKFGSYYQIVLEAGVDSNCDLEHAHNIAHNIEQDLINSGLKVKYVSVHINPCKKSISLN